MLTINVLGYGLDAKKGRNVNFTTKLLYVEIMFFETKRVR